MAEGGPIFPYSAYPVSSDVFPNVHVGGGGNSVHDEGLGVTASLTSDAIWRLRFQMPKTLPSGGTAKLKLRALAAATSGFVRVVAEWAMVAAESSPSGASLSVEENNDLTWAAGDTDVIKELKFNLDAATVTADNTLVMDLKFASASTLAFVSTWHASVVWE